MMTNPTNLFFERADVALVIGANDAVKPSARREKGRPREKE